MVESKEGYNRLLCLKVVGFFVTCQVVKGLKDKSATSCSMILSLFQRVLVLVFLRGGTC